jgi:predicted lipoprotein with Yx(FWY)xxD motif
VAHPLDSSDDRRSRLSSISRLTVPPALTACAVLVAACSSSPGSTAALRTATSTTTTTTFVAPTTPTTALAPFYEVTTASVPGLGTILVDGGGLTLYMFEPDMQSGKSTCYGECENLWPPVLLVGEIKAPVAGAGVNPSLLGTTVRTDGIAQITYNGWPLYLWHGDNSKPGETTGQGLNDSGGLWYVLDADGVPVTVRP